jgi:hypothetical protein
MRTDNLAAALVLACAFFFAPALASAQHEPMHAEHAHQAHDDERIPGRPTLRSRGDDLAMPILGIVGGVVFLGGGVAGLSVGALLALGDSLNHRSHDTTDLVLGLGAASAALGAICLVSGIVGLVGARHRARDAEQGPNLAGITLAPVEGGAVATAWGTF